MKTAICPGSFDPVTMGHMDIIERASKIFDRVIVAILVNSEKKTLFSAQERAELLRRAVGTMDNIEVECSKLLLADYARQKGDVVVVRGLRAVSDFEHEFQMALINRKLNPSLDTLFLTTNERYQYLSSSVIKEVGRLGGDISEFIPAEILSSVMDKIVIKK